MELLLRALIWPDLLPVYGKAFLKFNNMKIINALRQSASRAIPADDRIGYGIPDIKKAVVNLLKDFARGMHLFPTAQLHIQWKSKDMSSMKYELNESSRGKPIYLKIAERNGTGIFFGTRPRLINTRMY